MKQAGKMMEVANEMKKFRIDVMAVQEIRWKGEGRIDKPEFSIIYSGAAENTGQLGTGFLISKNARKSLLEYENINDRICRIRMKGKFRNITVISVHAPTEEKEELEKESFYETLDDVCAKTGQYDLLIVMGDFNAKIGKDEVQKEVAGIHTLHEKNNDNGNMLAQFAARNKLFIRSTSFPHRRIHLGTWMIPGSNETNQIDHVLVSTRNMSSIIDVRSCRGPNCDSDHFLVKIKVRERIANVRRMPRQESRRWATENLNKNKATRQRYQEVLSDKLEERVGGETTDPDGRWGMIEMSIKEAAAETLGTMGKARNAEWFDEDCSKVVDGKNEARAKMLQRITRSSVDRYEQLRREATKLLKRKKRESMKAQIEEIEHLSRQSESRKFYAAVNRMRRGFQPRMSGCKNKDGQVLGEEDKIMKRWAEHFEELLNEKGTEPETDEEAADELCMPDDDVTSGNVLTDLPTREEIAGQIRRLKNNKAPGEDEITAELLKYGGEELVKHVHALIALIWETEKMPSSWSMGTICPIFKKGDKLECRNYRGITLLAVTYKVLSSTINDRLKRVVEENIGEYQCGFRPGRGTTDQLFVVRQVMEKCYEHGIDLHMLFVDFKEAFDSVNRKELRKALEELEVPQKLVRLIIMTMSGSKSKVKLGNKMSEAFEFTKGVKQGDGLSATLFLIALHQAVKHLVHPEPIFHESSQLCAYADDIDVIALSKEKLVELYEELEQRAESLGLVVNEAKTKYMVVSASEAIREPQDLVIGAKKFEGVARFKYLGNMLDNEANTTTAIKDRLQSGNAAYAANLSLLRSKLLSRRTKLLVYKTLIRPVVTYGSETWVLTERDQSMLRRFERKIIRRIYGAVNLGNGEWRIRSNEEIDQILEQEDIVRFIKAQRIQWLGHVERMEDNRMPKKVLKAQLGVARRRGRPRLRWVQGVEKDLRTMMVRRRRAKIQDRMQWRAVVLEAKAHAGL